MTLKYNKLNKTYNKLMLQYYLNYIRLVKYNITMGHIHNVRIVL